jgi:hypothetical protein
MTDPWVGLSVAGWYTIPRMVPVTDPWVGLSVAGWYTIPRMVRE